MSDTAGSRSEGFVDQLLLEAGLEDDNQLRPALQELRALAAGAPEPSAAVAALMAPAPAAAVLDEVPQPEKGPQRDGVQPRDELAARRRTKRRIALTTLSVAVSLGAGGAVAAASDQGVRDSFNQLNQVITSFVTGSGTAPASHQPEEPAAPLQQTPASPATVPALPVPAPADKPAVVPPAEAPAGTEAPGTETAGPGKPAEDPAAEPVPATVPEHLTDGLGQRPPVPVPGPSDLPLPGTLPAVPLP
ncbi:hypothetical protein [Pseudarthrobacter sp. NamE5]|uniref:hypothetical protein n=1 Tax=Pseudarthrobacter sp. NamE5 TaxID=2576839 RepID=UPI00110A31FB|nr:hypothetical protein [Pseudarthrobacter sp. NamE5]TLM83073.1 hypothetical protein FDW84_14735 [Pseudarthrobacter sp. NamE5]